MHEPEEDDVEDEYECVLCERTFSHLPKVCECGNHTFNKIEEPADDPSEEWLAGEQRNFSD